MKKFAIPVAEGRLSQHFGHCEHFFFIEVDDNDNITNDEIIAPPEHTPGSYPNWLADNKVTDLIAGGLGQKAIDVLNQRGVNVFVGAPVKTPITLVKEFLAGTIETQANMCDH